MLHSNLEATSYPFDLLETVSSAEPNTKSYTAEDSPEQLTHQRTYYRTRRRRNSEIEEEGSEGDTSCPGMDSPSKTSEISSSMCSTPLVLETLLPTASGAQAGFCITPLGLGFTPCASPEHKAISLVLRKHKQLNPPILDLDSDATSGSDQDVCASTNSNPTTWSPKHRHIRLIGQTPNGIRSCLARTTSSPEVLRPEPSNRIFLDATSQYEQCHPAFFTTRSESQIQTSQSSASGTGKRGVRFCSKIPLTFPTHPNDAYDRTPHPVVPRLSYRDVLELREMKVEMALVTKRQQGAAGLGTLAKGHSPQDGNNNPTQEVDMSDMNTSGDRPLLSPKSLLEETESTENFPPSPSAHTSAFPSSVKLVSRLNEMGDFRPPARARGMGLKVEPSLGLDRVASGDSLRDDFTKNGADTKGSGSATPSSLRRKTSGEFEIVESEFARELRKARVELEAIAVQEARLGLTHQLGGQKSSKAEQHGVVMGSEGSAPSGLGMRMSPSLTSMQSGRALKTSSSISSLNSSGHVRSRTSSLSSNAKSSGLAPGREGDIKGEINKMTSLLHASLPDHDPAMFHRNTMTISEDNPRHVSEEGSILFPKPTIPASTNNSIFSIPSSLSNTTPSSRNAYRPPSPILAPFARSAPIRGTTQGSFASRRAAGAVVTGGPSRNFRPPSPILAPFTKN